MFIYSCGLKWKNVLPPHAGFLFFVFFKIDIVKMDPIIWECSSPETTLFMMSVIFQPVRPSLHIRAISADVPEGGLTARL